MSPGHEAAVAMRVVLDALQNMKYEREAALDDATYKMQIAEQIMNEYEQEYEREGTHSSYSDFKDAELTYLECCKKVREAKEAL